MSVQTKPLILVDGSSYLYRAFHALPPLMNSNNFPTGAAYGIINMLRLMIKTYHPDYLAVVFDAKGKTFRDDLYPAYKATREEMPSELVRQIAPIHSIIRALGFPLIVVDGVEADDVIGTLATHASQNGWETLISTGDKDLAQLVNDKVTLINTMNNTLLTPDGVKEKFGVTPEQIVDYLTLVGDTSDNIPGVPQVGPKTAAKWLQQYGSLDQLVTNADSITGKVGEKFRASIPQLPLTKSLVTIKRDVDLPLSFSELKIQAPDNNKLIELFKEMEFKSWLSELLNTTKDTTPEKKSHYEIITSTEKFNEWLSLLQKADTFAFDTETTSLDYMSANLVGLSFAISPEKVAYLPVGHDYEGAPQQVPLNTVLTALKPIFENPQQKKIGQNIKYDMEILANYNIAVQGVAFDTMMESYVLDSTGNRHDMDSLALKFLGWKTIQFEDVAGKGSKQLTFNQIDLQKAGEYAAEDADVTLRLHQTLWPKINAEAGLKTIFETIEMPLIPVLVHIERNGVLIDPIKLEKQGKELEKRLAELEKEAFILAGTDFNMNSPQITRNFISTISCPFYKKRQRDKHPQRWSVARTGIGL